MVDDFELTFRGNGVAAVSAQRCRYLTGGQVISTPPAVVAVSTPDANSGSTRPVFVFRVDWAATVVVGTANVSFQMELVNDAHLGTYSTPPVCAVTAPHWALGSDQRHCVSGDCNATSCTYILLLSSAGTYTLQVVWKAFGNVAKHADVAFCHTLELLSIMGLWVPVIGGW